MELTYEELIKRKHMMKDLNRGVAQLLHREPLFIHTDVEANLKSSFGNCTQHTGLDGLTVNGASIKISKYIDDEEMLKNTMLHELCHAYAPRHSNHGPAWKQIAQTVGEAYHTKITRVASPEESQEFRSSLPLVGKLICQKCGQEICLTSKNQVYKRRGQGYRCTHKVNGKKCGGSFDFVDLCHNN